MAEALARAENAEREAKEKQKKIGEVWDDRNRYKDKSEARTKELEAARHELEEVNRKIEENDLSLTTLNRKLVDARMTAVAWTMLEEDRITPRGSSLSTTLTYEQARTSLTPEALEAYLLRRVKAFYKFQPDLKAIVEAHSKLLSPAVGGIRWDSCALFDDYLSIEPLTAVSCLPYYTNRWKRHTCKTACSFTRKKLLHIMNSPGTLLWRP